MPQHPSKHISPNTKMFTEAELTAQMTTDLTSLMATNLAALVNILTIHPSKMKPIVLRAWRAVQSTQRLVHQAQTDEEADLEALALRVRWAKEIVDAAFNTGKKQNVQIGAIHPSLLAEKGDKVGTWLDGVSFEKIEPTQARTRAWELGMDIDVTYSEFDIDVRCLCCPPRSVGKAKTQARVLGLAIDIGYGFDVLERVSPGSELGGYLEV
ncbi:uncharacterized protein N0V89_008737 [Didymosphaeria variabile]|uniref:Uncharacterized protein n=1 Tax=Didymosphaeria variabile TaxID=1932322 RepID=A0A9W8XIQ8_9PLEO|nr:uncharacterized protein N0V89_008737 [Didymosphaeria variabile]KAJ4350116.1 hypothetical protein N0V89_008737 [Didymosphaeria variabile]